MSMQLTEYQIERSLNQNLLVEALKAGGAQVFQLLALRYEMYLREIKIRES